MDIGAVKPKASQIPLENLAGNPNVSQGDKVREASRQFEAVLLRQILSEARKTVVSSTANTKSSSAGIYDDMINNQMADSISKSGSFGLAKSLQAQLVHQVLPNASSTPPQAAPLGVPSKNSKTH
jgi:peptidoglycan hydrolase FlgJ